MKYLTATECAQLWNISARCVRSYCEAGRVKGAILDGKQWRIPDSEEKPRRKPRTGKIEITAPISPLLTRLEEERRAHLHGGIYHKVQIELTYNSNHIEGSRLTHDQTRYIFETATVGITDNVINVDDIVETSNHFHCIDYLIETVRRPLDEKYIKNLHFMLKIGTVDSRKEWFAVGGYKKLPNEVGNETTSLPENVHSDMKRILKEYEQIPQKSLEDIINFHVQLEHIHPFQDGNGRVGRLIMFKECLKNNIVPFIIEDDMKMYYYRGIKQWKEERGFLRDTCLAAQDRFKRYLEYFRIPYAEERK